ncbi:MAG: GNAT family N-acetyltransferase [Proteobacteria bacterium]|nr:GNAT family N-acetyltransferase [Pseudomonadota bacterium]
MTRKGERHERAFADSVSLREFRVSDRRGYLKHERREKAKGTKGRFAVSVSFREFVFQIVAGGCAYGLMCGIVKEQMIKVNANPENDITIYLAETKDWQTIRDVMLEMLADAPHAFGETLAKAKARDVNEWKHMTGQLTNTPDSCVYIATDHQGVCAFVLADTGFPQLPPGAVLAARLWVTPRRRGMGLGRKLMDVVSCWAKEQGMDQIYVGITDTNLDVVKFYEHLGYRDTGRREQLPNDAQRHIIVMSRKLEQ